MKKKLLFLFLMFSFTSSQAQVAFHKYYGVAFDDLHALRISADGGYIMAGIALVPGSGWELCLSKTDLNGQLLWSKTFGGQFHDFAYDVKQCSDGGFILTGSTPSFGAGSEDIYLIKTDSVGNLSWSKTYGNAFSDVPKSVEQTNDGGFVIAGYGVPNGITRHNVCVLKTDAIGDTLWTKFLEIGGQFEAYAIHETSDSGYILTGRDHGGGLPSFNILVIKIDSIGNPQWSRLFGGSGDEFGHSVQETFDGGYLVYGITNSFNTVNEFYAIKTDANGDTLWTKTYGGIPEFGGGWWPNAWQTTDSGFVFTGTLQISSNQIYAALAKCDSLGNIVWSKMVNSSNNSFYGRSVQQTMDGGFVLGVGPGVMIVKTDMNGNMPCNMTNIALTAATPPTQVFIPSVTVYSGCTVTTPATVEAVHVGVDSTFCFTVGLPEIPALGAMMVSPNPSEGRFIVSFNKTIQKGTVTTMNLLGEIIHTDILDQVSEKEIHLENVRDGIYFVRVIDGSRSFCKKLVIENSRKR